MCNNCSQEIRTWFSRICISISFADRIGQIETEKEVKIYYDDKEVGLHRLDLVVEGQVIVEMKAVKGFDDSHLAQLISYLKATKLKVGLLLNFAKSVLKIKRVMN